VDDVYQELKPPMFSIAYPEAEERLLDDVLGLGRAPEHPGLGRVHLGAAARLLVG
jgi:hypothetical protein